MFKLKFLKIIIFYISLMPLLAKWYVKFSRSFMIFFKFSFQVAGNSQYPTREYCYINKGDYYGNNDCWGTSCNPTYNYRYTQTLIQGVFRDFYEADPIYFDWEIDGVIGTNIEVDGTCGKTSTGFGDVNYVNTCC